MTNKNTQEYMSYQIVIVTVQKKYTAQTGKSF